MKKAIERIVPKQILALAKTVYWKLFANRQRFDFSSKQHMVPSTLKCVVSYNKYGGYCVPDSSRHRPAAKAILSGNVWEPQTIIFMRTNCMNGDIVHAGTFFGDFLPALSKGVGENSKIWAYEPNPENYRCARITLDINDLTNVILTNAGLGAKDEFLFLQTTDESGKALGGASQIIAKGSNGDVSGKEVQIVTIDGTVGADRKVSIIQLDVEGHEMEALSGALKTIQRCLPILILEVLPNCTLLDSDWFAKNISSLGYRKIGNVHMNYVFGCEPSGYPNRE